MQGPGPGARTWICPRVLLGEPGSTVGRLTQLMAPPRSSGTKTSPSPAPAAPKARAGSRAPAFTSRALANREPAPPSLGQSPRSRAVGGRFLSGPAPWWVHPARVPGAAPVGRAFGAGPGSSPLQVRGGFAYLVVDSGVDAPPGEAGQAEAPWKKMSKEVGGLRREAGAEDCSLGIRWNS